MAEFFNLIKPELIYLLRVIIASVCGIFLGLERSRRQKEAGIRTHFVVAGASALIMAVSVSFEGAGDEARIAAQIVSGVGFLGAGMIFFRRESLHGLTTAAGIWATAGIGMAAGKGLYLLAIGGTLIIYFVQSLFHSNRIKFYNNQAMYLVRIDYSEENKKLVEDFFASDDISRLKVVTEELAVKAEFFIRSKTKHTIDEICLFTTNNKGVRSIERMEDL